MQFLMGACQFKSSSLKKKATAARGGKQKGAVAKDESFFDSHGYLDSDGEEEDYYSVKGEPTSSSDGTPKHHTGTDKAPQVNNVLRTNGISDSKSESSPKKNLAQLLGENTAEESDDMQAIDGNAEVDGESQMTTSDWHPMAIKKTPNFPGTKSTNTSEKTPVEGGNYGKVKTKKKRVCCLPTVHRL